jgi:hypothetical protein
MKCLVQVVCVTANHLTRTALLAIAATILLGNQSATAQTPELINRSDGKFVIRAATSVNASGLEIFSVNGILIPGTSAEPFHFVLAATPNQITLASIPDVFLSGLHVMEMGWDTARADEYDAISSWGTGTAPPIGKLPPGDCNADFKVDADDLSCVADVEQRDIVLEELNTLPGDLDGNGDVSFADYLTLSNNIGQDPANYAEGNIDLIDGVTQVDFLILSDNFGKTPGDVAAVPEPSACVPVWLLGIAAFWRSRRS